VALRDDETGALASGVDVRLVRLLVFAASSALAALGGALLAMGSRAFDNGAFDPLFGLIWFAAVVVFGIDSAPGAVICAGFLVAMDTSAPAGTSILAIGGAALLLGRLPGGLLHSVHRMIDRVTRRRVPAPVPEASTTVRLTPAGRSLARAIHRPTAQGRAAR
jgi:branched-chain amino acid transport system permease protein